MFGAMQVAKRIPFDDHPEYITYARGIYLAAQLACLAVFYFCQIRVGSCSLSPSPHSPMSYLVSDSDSGVAVGCWLLQVKKANDLTVIKYVNAKNPMSQEPGELVTTTNRDYDLAEISKSMRGTLMGCAMVGFMHLYLGYTNPLVIQSILPVKNALESNMAKIWVWGQPATGDLKRPFKAPPGLFGKCTCPCPCPCSCGD